MKNKMPENRETEAPFNMAVATLMRIDIILKEIKNLSYRFSGNSAEKQKAYIELVKQFYINAVPLLGDEADKYKKEILGLQLNKRRDIKSGNQKYIYCYSPKKEERLNEILVEIQQKLKKFFMPGRKAEGLI
jgi:hypothetical protein